MIALKEEFWKLQLQFKQAQAEQTALLSKRKEGILGEIRILKEKFRNPELWGEESEEKTERLQTLERLRILKDHPIQAFGEDVMFMGSLMRPMRAP